MKNPAIGTCPCPIHGCTATCEVRKFQHKATRDTATRFAGKLYMACPKHGRFGYDATEDMQEWILENAKLNSPDDAPPVKPEPPAKPARAEPPARESAREPTPPAKRGGFGFFGE